MCDLSSLEWKQCDYIYLICRWEIVMYMGHTCKTSLFSSLCVQTSHSFVYPKSLINLHSLPFFIFTFSLAVFFLDDYFRSILVRPIRNLKWKSIWYSIYHLLFVVHVTCNRPNNLLSRLGGRDDGTYSHCVLKTRWAK